MNQWKLIEISCIYENLVYNRVHISHDTKVDYSIFS